jgi:hypothetical protein
MTLTRGRLIGCYEFDGMVVLFSTRRDSVPLFNGTGRRPLTDQNWFAPAHKVPRAERGIRTISLTS